MNNYAATTIAQRAPLTEMPCALSTERRGDSVLAVVVALGRRATERLRPESGMTLAYLAASGRGAWARGVRVWRGLLRNGGARRNQVFKGFQRNQVFIAFQRIKAITAPTNPRKSSNPANAGVELQQLFIGKGRPHVKG